MQSYMERRLIGAHEAGTQAQFKPKCITFLVGAAAVVILPFIHLGLIYYVWVPNKGEVNKANCKCDCFDTVFRGRYEWPPSSYKHVYFNCTAETMRIWIVIILGVLAFYESVRYVAMAIWRRRVRVSMLALYVSSLYPHYYGWWNFFNYYNEEFYQQFWHQIFFSLTEVLSTIVVTHLINQDNKVESWKLLAILDINIMHVIVGCLDQFIDNILYRQGKGFEAARDFGLLIPDIFHVLLCYFEIGALAERKRTNVFNLFYKEEIMASLVLVSLFSLLGKQL